MTGPSKQPNRWDFDARARQWDAEDPLRVERTRAIAETMRAMVGLRPDLKGLEYGCGTGLLSLALGDCLGEILMADSSEGMLAVLREKLAAGAIDHLKPVKWDLLTDPLLPDRFGFVCSQLTLHHLRDTDRVLRTFHALLVPHGSLCVADLDREDGSFHGAGFTGHNGFDREELAEKARRAGFRNPRFRTACDVEKRVDGELRRYPVFVMAAEKG